MNSIDKLNERERELCVKLIKFYQNHVHKQYDLEVIGDFLNMTSDEVNDACDILVRVVNFLMGMAE